MTLQLRIELEPLQDVASELTLILSLLRHHHGHRFRALEMRIVALEVNPGRPSVHPVEDGLIVVAPDEWTAILKEARRLSVI